MPKGAIRISGPWLRGIRHSKALTQRELADRLGFTTRNIQRVEDSSCASVTARFQRRLAEFLGIPPEQLASRSWK